MAANQRPWYEALPKRNFPTVLNRNSNVPPLPYEANPDFEGVDSAVWSDPLSALEARPKKTDANNSLAKETSSQNQNLNQDVAKPLAQKEPNEEKTLIDSSPKTKKPSVGLVVVLCLIAVAVLGAVVAVLVMCKKKQDPGPEDTQST